MINLCKRCAVPLLALLSLTPMLLFAYLGQFSRMLADDYLVIKVGQEIGPWQLMLHWREIWSGEYSNNFVIGLLAPLDTALPALFPLFIIVAAGAGFAWLSSALLAHLRIQAHRRAIAIALASLTVAAAINGFYSGQLFYWFSATVEYTFPALLLLLGIAMAVETGRRLRGGFQHLTAAIAVGVYTFINAGFGEMYLVAQLTFATLIFVCVAGFLESPKRKTYLILAIAAVFGTAVGLATQLSAPGLAYRSALPETNSFTMQPLRDLPLLLTRTLDATAEYLGKRASFAGFMLVAAAGLFAALTGSSGDKGDASRRTFRANRSAIGLGLLIQLVFVPLLWSHQSDNPQVFGRFSYAFLLVILLNLLTILVMTALLWQRKFLDRMLNSRQGLMIYSGCALLAVCLLFALSQIRNPNYKAETYLFVTSAALLIMLASQLKPAAEPRLHDQLLATAFVTFSTAIVLAAIIGAALWGAGFIIDRILAAVTILQMSSGLMCGLTLGAFMQRASLLTNSNAAWLKWIRTFCLLIVITIAIGMIIGQGQRISHFQRDAEIWESTHQEIIRLRDAGDAAVTVKAFPRRRLWRLDETPSSYRVAPLTGQQLIYYGLKQESKFEE